MKTLLSLLLIPTAVMCFCCGGFPASREEVKKKIDKADVLWDSGKKTDAVMEYRRIFEDARSDEKERMLPRIVEFEVNAGNNEEAKKWIKRGLEDKLKVEYSDPAAKKVFAVAKNEYDEAAAEKERKELEEKAKAEREAAEREAARKKAEAVEAARPKPSRANYNKIKIGMSLGEVQAILGPGEENARGPGVLIATWQSEAGLLELPTIITITFQNGRVESKAIAP